MQLWFTVVFVDIINNEIYNITFKIVNAGVFDYKVPLTDINL